MKQYKNEESCRLARGLGAQQSGGLADDFLARDGSPPQLHFPAGAAWGQEGLPGLSLSPPTHFFLFSNYT